MPRQKQFHVYNPLHLLTLLVGRYIHRLEYDPVTQFRFHFFFTWFWFLTIIAVVFIVPHHSATEWVALVILEVSLWANFVSHMTALGSAIAGIFASGREHEVPGLHNAEVPLDEIEASQISTDKIAPETQNVVAAEFDA